MSDLACIVYLTVTLPLFAVLLSRFKFGEEPVRTIGLTVS